MNEYRYYLPRYCSLVLLGFVLLGSQALATDEIPNECSAGGRGDPCLVTQDCVSKQMATMCVDQSCQIPCVDGDNQKAGYMCSLGETCVSGVSDQGLTFFCRPSSFTMDLNLLDSCIYHFVNDLRPDLSSQDECSLARNLNLFLDQDGNHEFDIFDVDLCIREFLASEACDTDNQTCPNGQTCCQSDQDCGEGLYCNSNLNRCERECGFISNRMADTIDTLERKCSGRLKTCNYLTGQCIDIDLDNATCSIDRDCPEGAYCYLGYCQPKCHRSIDCPDSSWYCSADNSCRPKPLVEAHEIVDPKEYSIQFGIKQVTLEQINDQVELPLLIMSLKNKKQVFDNPSLVFGYRMEIEYALKQDPKCQARQGDSCLDGCPDGQECIDDACVWTAETRDDCIVSPEEDEGFVKLLNPFGTVYAVDSPSVGLKLDHRAIDELSSGTYQATVRAIFDNGNQSAATIRFVKTSLSGFYSGRLSIFADAAAGDGGSIQNLLGTTDFSAKLYVNTKDQVEWDQLLLENNLLDGEQDIVDMTKGYRVEGYLDGNSSLIFNNPLAIQKVENQIPVKGIYSPNLKRMRLISVIDMEGDHCRSDRGLCTGASDEIEVHNLFRRKIRRLIQFVGPYDSQTREFHGMYRETISGLVKYDFTLEGSFRMGQSLSNEGELNAEKLLDPSQSDPVGFPTELVDNQINQEVNTYCIGELEGLKAKFEDKESYLGYLNDAESHKPILSQLVSFSKKIDELLGPQNMNEASVLANQNMITIRDFLRGTLFLCSENSDKNCIDENKVRCGLALYRKAALSGWIDMTDFKRKDPDGEDLYCSDVGCDFSDATGNATLLTLQEHNRFHRELLRALKYQAGNDLSDAFYVLYRNSLSAFDAYEAISVKEQKLLSALRRYDQIRAEIFSPASTSMLFSWNMSEFKTLGDAMLRPIHSVLLDRLDAIASIIDVKRRLLQQVDSQDFSFVQHLMQQEYLSQVFLFALEADWKKSQFLYAGNGPLVLERGGQLLSQVNNSRNPLGLRPDEIFFENGNLVVNNWQNYMNIIKTGGVSGGGMLGDTKLVIDAAVNHMRNSLADRNRFLEQVLLEKQQFEAEINQLCGVEDPYNPIPDECKISKSARKNQENCTDSACLAPFQCEDGECDSVAQYYSEASENVACRKDGEYHAIEFNGRERPCVRGQMGALLEERVMLELQRQKVKKRIQGLLRQVENENQMIRETLQDNEEILEYLVTHSAAMIKIDQTILSANALYESAVDEAAAMDCWTLTTTGGVASNCLNAPARASIVTGAKKARDAALEGVTESRQVLERLKDVFFTDKAQQAELRRMRMDLDNLTTEVENYVSEYEMVLQQLYNLERRVADLKSQAQLAADHHSERNQSIVDTLVGSESGNVLLRNQYVKKADSEFRKLLVVTYKMAMAFSHAINAKNYNVVGPNVENSVFKLLTPDDVEHYVNWLAEKWKNYCGYEGLDCDFDKNNRPLRFSLREELFPTLRDIVDSKTGKVLTKGQQFHNLITSSSFLKRRMRGTDMIDQIEIPFSVWPNDRGTASNPEKRYMINPLECNHIIVADKDQHGTIAVNVVGTRLGGGDQILYYEMHRGNIDYLRSCEQEEVTLPGGDTKSIYPIKKYVVGYAPGSALAEQNEAPTFHSQTQFLSACKNTIEDISTGDVSSSCYRFFARDRSLAALDWKLVIPLLDDNYNRWILGEGLDAIERPIIEDIIIYIRHRQRPRNNN